jgi:hypothetical protein
VSGTLAFAMGAGKAIISTPYWHAKELLDDGRGALVPFEDPGALAAAAIDLLENSEARQTMRQLAYLYGRDMVWNKVARPFLNFRSVPTQFLSSLTTSSGSGICPSMANIARYGTGPLLCNPYGR